VGKFSKDLLEEDKLRQTYLDINFEGETYHIGQHMWDAMCQQAASREMTIDEYIAEAFTLLKEKKLTKQSNLEQDIIVLSQTD
jgi:predicted DNA-binding protein (MmcQ/YjbR family)